MRLGEALTQSEKATLAGLRCRRRRREERCTNPDDGELNVQCRGLGHLRALVRFRRPTIVTAKLEAAGRPTRRLVRGGGLAAISGGLPSTAWALLTRGDPLAAARAAGTLVPGRRERPNLFFGAIVHIGISAAWTTAFGLVGRRWRWGTVRGAAAGLGIAALDLVVFGRRFPSIAALPQGAQWADHVVFGAVLGRALRA